MDAGAVAIQRIRNIYMDDCTFEDCCTKQRFSGGALFILIDDES
jgi:hypothetical protein